MEWSPQDALKAYLQTLHLCKANNNMHNREEKFGVDSNKSLKSQKEGINNLVESQGLELISALAAGNQAKVLVEITNFKQGITPFTIALAVAAKQTRGKLICIFLNHDYDGFNLNLDLRKIKKQLSFYGIDSIIHHDHDHDRSRDLDQDQNQDQDDQDGVVELRVGDPYEEINDLKNIDFAVIDCKFDQSWLRCLCKRIHLNPKGAMIVANNVLHRRQSVALVDEVLKGIKRGVESSVTTLPMGPVGIQVIIRIKPMMPIKPPQTRRHKRFLVTFDD